jgi:hypothetical protein
MIAAFTMVYGGEEDEPMVGGKDMSSIKPALDLSLPETQNLNQFLPCQIAPDKCFGPVSTDTTQNQSRLPTLSLRGVLG